ncbi:MAG: hypothetical protein EPO21_04295 [Chloroflexota bacterium]|nr:MAG: hypothetical protein EPO21_04295 [Chloroflexota bacterium]
MSKIATFLARSLVIAIVAALPFGLLTAYASDDGDKPVATLKASIVGNETRFIVTVHDKNDRPVPNVPVSLVAEHAQQPSGGHAGMNMAPTLSVRAAPSTNPGEYTASLRMAGDGEWKITVTHGSDKTEFSYSGTREPVRITAKGHTSEQPTGHAEQSPAVRVDRVVGPYAVTLTMEEHVAVEKEGSMLLTVTDSKSGAPISGLNVAFIPVPLAQGEGGAHGGSGGGDGDHGANKEGEPAETVVPAIEAKERADSPGRYEVKHTFEVGGPHTLLVRLGDANELIPMPIDVETPHSEQTTGPNYWFVGSVLTVLLMTILLVTFLRLRDLSPQPAKARQS